MSHLLSMSIDIVEIITEFLSVSLLCPNHFQHYFVGLYGSRWEILDGGRQSPLVLQANDQNHDSDHGVRVAGLAPHHQYLSQAQANI